MKASTLEKELPRTPETIESSPSDKQLPSTPNSTTASPMDKELPAKPALRASLSPERRGILGECSTRPFTEVKTLTDIKQMPPILQQRSSMAPFHHWSPL